ncbi:hypothetical protein ACJIZ3_014517 [Penstemon smallii]|uniref:K Homology domain-containing protein n=1 Tax=Penstemon smallii TaxID=265156 RepID=A0ABD3RJS1_9LAMI
MEGNRRNFLNKHSNPQFKRKGGPRNGKSRNFNREEFPESSHLSDTVYRIICQSKKIGSVIGKGGSIVKALREDTQAKITVSDSVPGSDERVIIILSPSDKRAKRQSNTDDHAEKGDDDIELHCAAQDALLKVHDRIIEEDLSGADNNDEDGLVVTARLLVSNNMVGCVLGRKGDVIQRLRSETGANIRVLPADHLPSCAMSDDQLVQISGKPAIAKKALFEISTLLHQNPRKDKPPLSFPTSFASHGLHPPGPPERNMRPPGNLSWFERTTDVRSMPSLPPRGGYGIQPSRFGPEDFDGIAPRDQEAPSEFTMKILCSAEKIGGVIGKGGLNVRQLQHETGASIHVENVSPESGERVICVSSLEVLRDQRSQTIDAVLHLQNKTSEYSEKGTITTRLLVPSSKVGCILGQGGHVINEMRRRTHADIRIFSKEDKPKCASEDEELVQISGSFGVAKDALGEISSRLRTRFLRDVNSKGEPAPDRPLPEFGPARHLNAGGLHPSNAYAAGSSGRYEILKGGFHEYESPSFPVPPRPTGYTSVNEAKMSPMLATGGSRSAEFAGTRPKFQDPYSTGSDYNSSEHLNAMLDMYRTPSSSAGPSNYPQRSAYESYNTQQGAYPNSNASQVPYQNTSPQPNAYQNTYTQQGSYQNIRPHGSYPY